MKKEETMAEKIFGVENPQEKKERLELEKAGKYSQLKREFTKDKNEGMYLISNYLIKELKLKERIVSERKISAEIEKILDTLATSYVIREITAKIKRKTYGTNEETFETIKTTDLLKTDLPKERFVIEPLIPLTGITIISGQPGVGKSWFSLEVLRATVTGKKLFGKLNSVKQKVLLIDEESNTTEIQRRLRLLGIKHENFAIMSQKGIKIDNEEQIKDLINFVKDKFDVVVFDSLRSLHSRDENSSKESQQIIEAFREFNRAGISVIAIHHNRKEGFLASKEPSQILRGSSALLGGIDSLLSLDGKEINPDTIEMSIVQAKLRRGKKSRPFRLYLKEEEGKMYFEYKGEIIDALSKKVKAKELIIQLIETEGKKYRQDILNILLIQDIKTKTIDTAIKELKEEKKLFPKKGEKNKIFYDLS